MDEQMSSWGAFRARTGPWLGDVKGWLELGADCSSSSLAAWMQSLPAGLCSRTSLVFCPPAPAPSASTGTDPVTEAQTSLWSSQDSPDITLSILLTAGEPPDTAEATKEAPRGVCWTLEASEFPIADAECSSLSTVLESEPVPSKFYLTPRAARGVLRRAETRGRTLPDPLWRALSRLAGGGGLTDDAVVGTRNRIDFDTETFVCALDQRGGALMTTKPKAGSLSWCPNDAGPLTAHHAKDRTDIDGATFVVTDG